MKTLALLLFLLVSTVSLAQQTQQIDVIYLKDGMELRGKIIERLDDGAIKMVMTSGIEITVSMKNVRRITIEGIGSDPKDYGGKTAIGVSLFGENAFAGHFRIKAADELFLDVSLGPEFFTLQNRGTNKYFIKTNLLLGGEANYFLKRFYKASKQKIRANGLFARVSHGFGEYGTSYLAGGWSSEYFKQNRFKRGFLLNLGLGIKYNHWYKDPANYAYIENVPEAQLIGYIRLQWNFFQ